MMNPKDNGRLLMLLGKSGYGALNNYLKELGAAFKDMGYEVEYFDGTQINYGERLYDITLKNEYKAIFACNAILTGWDKLVLKDSIFCCLMFDHPVQLFERIRVADENVVIIHCDSCSANYIAKYCSNVGSVGFVPLSGSYVMDKIPYNKRKYDIVFTGSNNSSNDLYVNEISVLKPSDRIIADILIKKMKDRPMITQQQSLEEYFNESGQEVTNVFFHNTMGRLRNVEAYMRAWIREQIIRSIVDGGIKINIFGRNWENFECKHPENIIRMDGCGETSLHTVANSRIALNVMPWFRGGFQERIASAMLCGAIALTDSSTYIEDNFINGEDIVTFDPAKPQEIPEIITSLLNDQEKAESIAKSGYNKAIKNHTWKNRAVDVMEIIDDSINWLKSAKNNNARRKVSVSVVVPVYNAESTLVACLSNLVNQTLEDIEIILVNDCSVDGSEMILKECEMQYPDKVVVITLDNNVGAGGARNVGIQYAHGDYIGFVDSDDIIDPSMFEKMYAKAVSGNYDIVDVGFYKEESDECILYTGEDCEGELDGIKRSKLIYGAGGYIWSKIFKKDIFNSNVSAFRENCIMEDCDFMLNMFATVRSIGTVKEVLYIYKYYANSASRNTEIEFYYRSVMDTLNAIYNRLSVLNNYHEIKDAVESVMFKLYSCTLNQCISYYCNKRVIGGEMHIKKLHSLKKKIISGTCEKNKFVKQVLGKEDIKIINVIDKLY